jgi:hypothetical protein
MWAPRLAASLVERGVRRHPVQPRRERRAAVETADAAGDCDHRLLRGVERVLRVAENAPADRMDAIDVSLQQRLERGAVTCTRARGEIVVGAAFVSGPRP